MTTGPGRMRFKILATQLWPDVEMTDDQRRDAIRYVHHEWATSEGHFGINLGRFKVGRVIQFKISDDGLGIEGEMEFDYLKIDVWRLV